MTPRIMVVDSSNNTRWRDFINPAFVKTPTVDSFVYGTTMPVASNSGLLAGPSPVTDSSGFTVQSTPKTYDSSYSGQTIRFVKFTAKPSVTTAQDLTFEYCIFAVPGDKQIQCTSATNTGQINLTLRYCQILPPTPYNYQTYSIFGRGYTLDRCDVSRCVDLCSIVGSSTSNIDLNVVLKGNYLHHQLYEVPDLNQSDNKTHNDGCQVHYGGNNITIYGNNFEGTVYTAGSTSGAPTWNGDGSVASGNIYDPNDPVPISVMMFSPTSAAAGINNVRFDSNWAGGSEVVINFPRTDGTNIQIINNRWRPTYNGSKATGPSTTSSLDGTFWILAKTAQAITVTGNILLSDSSPQNGRHPG